MLRSRPHAAWAVGVFFLDLIYIPSIEEPALEARFGESYLRYKANVRRFIPRLRPWRPDARLWAPASSDANAR